MSPITRISGYLSRFRKTALLVCAAAVLIWVAFFDSHSLYSRVKLIREKAHLEKENGQIRKEIAHLEDMLARDLTDEEIERIAREQYGMSRPDETVYPVVDED